VTAAQTVGLDVAGIDLIAEDIGRPLEVQHGAIIEVNASPGLVMHIKPLVGKPRPVGEAIVNHLFGPGDSGRVPLVAVSGTNGKSAVAALVAAMLTAGARTVGQAGSYGLKVGERVLDAGDCRNAASARRLLVNPFIDAMVIETSEIGVIREGLAFDRCQVAVVTNLGAGDHLAEQYVDDRDFVARAIRAPVDVVLPDGFAVLNADEPEVSAMAQKCRGSVVFFAQNARADLVREHLAKGGRAVSVADAAIVALHGEQVQRLVALDAVRSKTLGLPPMRVGNLLAAAGAGIALGLPPGAIRQGLESAPPLPGEAVYADGDRRVLVTPARNPSALAAWIRTIESAFPGRKRVAAIGVPWDWRQEDAAAMGGLLRDAFQGLCLVADANPAQTEKLFEIIGHNSMGREDSWPAAIDRIIAGSGSSHLVFVSPSKRAGCNQANEHCERRNMVRLS
jgi:cyanophycin synthetase